jgi:hypothetical protein
MSDVAVLFVDSQRSAIRDGRKPKSVSISQKLRTRTLSPVPGVYSPPDSFSLFNGIHIATQ